MYKIVIWGLGKLSEIVFESLKYDKCKVTECIDIRAKSYNLEDKKYISKLPENLIDMDYDYIIVSASQVEDIKKMINNMKISKDKVIYFWHQDIGKYNFISEAPKELYILKSKLRNYEIKLNNAPYEYGNYKKPIIKPAEELLLKIKDEKKSLCRYGDGEFELIFGRERSKFQSYNKKFSTKLREVLNSKNNNIIIAIADNYGSLEKYTEEAAQSIRNYLLPDIRREHMKILDLDRVYYDAYVSRCYMIYKDKTYSQRIFKLYKQIFYDRDLLIIEGYYTRNGYKNDLFEGAKSISRIICPDKNCYDVYDEIYHGAIKYANKNTLILITLGSVATILAYDLAMLGFQAIDLGQLDNEYEWSLVKAKKIEPILGKTVSDIVNDTHLVEKECDDVYNKQIVLKLKC